MTASEVLFVAYVAGGVISAGLVARYALLHELPRGRQISMGDRLAAAGLGVAIGVGWLVLLPVLLLTSGVRHDRE